MMKNIRNFSIIAHIDHGKSTLADRMLEVTNTIEKRKMRDQVLDSMELERERGITIKMQPVRMHYASGGKEYILNLIDTPGHFDFAYEVSRALKAVEGSILLVDATQGVQAQTFSTLDMAREQGLVIIPVLSKIDSPLARVGEVKQEVAELLKCSLDDILLCSGKTGEGVGALLEAVIERVPAPESHDNGGDFQALVFDFQYSNHRGIIVYVRVFSGSISKNIALRFSAAHERFLALETGIFAPQEQPSDNLSDGEIGYIVTGIKKPGVASVGDTLIFDKSGAKALPGYLQPRPVVWARVYPESQDDFNLLKQSLLRLRLSDSSLSFEEESSGSFGRGFRCGFLGMLHLEIITERLRREFGLELVVTTPSITYRVAYKNAEIETIYTPSFFPEDHLISSVSEPWIKATIILLPEHMSNVLQLLYEFEAELAETETFGEGRMELNFQMPLRELMRGFFDKLKAATSGYGSI